MKKKQHPFGLLFTMAVGLAHSPTACSARTAVLNRIGSKSQWLSSQTLRMPSLLTSILVFAVTPVYADLFNFNLISNPGAEASGGSPTGFEVVTAPNWITASNFTVVVSAAAPMFGKNAFIGGPDTPLSNARQTIDVSAEAATIDSGNAVGELSGYFGGFLSQDDRASLAMTCLDANTNALSNLSIGDVLAVDRTNITCRLYRAATTGIPAGTRRILLVQTMIRAAGNYNDGLTDNLSLVLRMAPVLVAGTQTPIPGGTGNFSSLAQASLSGSKVAFFGAGSGGQQGIYTSIGTQSPPQRIADTATAIPGGTGNFTAFETAVSVMRDDVVLNDYLVVFQGSGSGGYGGTHGGRNGDTGASAPFRIVDTATAIPGGSGNFTSFTPANPVAPGLDGNVVSFFGAGSGAQRGVYAAAMSPPQVGPPFRIADTATAIPGGSGNFTDFPTAATISGNNAIFAGYGGAGQRGVYAAAMSPPQAGPPFRIADTATAIPGGTGNFSDFTAEPSISGNRAVFVGSGGAGQRGVYAAAMSPPQAGPPSRIADTATAIPGGTGNFTSFGQVSISDTDIAFLGNGPNGQQGIYDLTGGSLVKVVALADILDGQAVTGLQFTRMGLSGDAVAFQATFADGSQRIYTAAVTPPFGLRITAAEKLGNNLRLSFMSLMGTNYAIESRADLSSGTWATLPGTTNSGTGGIVQQTLTNALTQPKQCYRVKQLP